MNIFKEAEYHAKLENDIEMVHAAFSAAQTRVAEKALDALVDRLEYEVHNNLTPEAAVEFERLTEKYEGEDGLTVVAFMVWRQHVNVVSADEFSDVYTDLSEGTTELRVYQDDLFIEKDADGRCSLVIENSSWSEPETSLEALEMHLFKYYNLT